MRTMQFAEIFSMMGGRGLKFNSDGRGWGEGFDGVVPPTPFTFTAFLTITLMYSKEHGWKVYV